MYVFLFCVSVLAYQFAQLGLVFLFYSRKSQVRRKFSALRSEHRHTETAAATDSIFEYSSSENSI